MMSAFQHKGYFNDENFNKFSCGKKFYYGLAFTILGLLIMPVIDIFLKLETLINFILLPFMCKTSGMKEYNRLVHEWMENRIENIFNLNPFELETFEK